MKHEEELMSNRKIINDEVKKFNELFEMHQIDKARSIIKISKIICNTKVAERDFSFVKNYGEVITNNDIDYGIRACKIKDIDEFVYLGWNRIRKIAENTIKHETISLKNVTNEYGDLKIDENLNTYLIHVKLKRSEINIDKKYVSAEVKNGLTLNHLNRTAIQHLKKSGNKTESLKFVQFHIYPDVVNSVITKTALSKNDVQHLESSFLFFKELFSDAERLSSIPHDVLQKLCEMTANLLKKYAEINSKFKNNKICNDDVCKLQQQIKKYGEVA